MRTAIILGLMFIASAIRKDVLGVGAEIPWATIFVVAIMFVMDISEFIKNMTKK